MKNKHFSIRMYFLILKIESVQISFDRYICLYTYICTFSLHTKEINEYESEKKEKSNQRETILNGQRDFL